MSDAPGQPRWERLPHDPRSFFELESGFDRKDLKRAYNRLLKQFKPEKHPQEFQRIREAYEQLDNQLRYGTEATAPGVVIRQYSWQVPETTQKPGDASEGGLEAAEVTPSTGGASPSAPTPLFERVASEPADVLYAELKQLEDKRPYHYFALAVLSDTVEGKDPQRFVKWLLTGLRQSPRDPALFQLLYAYVRGPVEDKEVAGLLLMLSQGVRDDRFYFLTEPLWDRLLRGSEFDVFRRTLEKCEGNLSDYQLVRKLTFYTHILKGAIWSGDDDWTANAFAFVEEHHRELPPQLEYDVEVLFQLREYMQQRQRFLSGHPLRKLLDHTIRAYCTGDALAAERAFVDCQVRLMTSGMDLLDAFPVMEESEALGAFSSLWHWLNAEFADRVNQRENEPREAFGIRPVLLEIESKTDRSMLGRMWNWSVPCYGIGRFLIYVVLYLLLYVPFDLTLARDSGLRGVLVFVCLGVAAVGGWLFNRHVAGRLWSRWCFRMARKCYEATWRREMQQLLARTFLPFREVLERIDRVKDPDGELSYRSWVLAFAGRDFGLLMYSYAQRFVA